MLSRYTEKNKFGGYTWQIKLDSLFHIYVNGTDNESFVVEFKEYKWISFKTHFSFVSNESLEDTIVTAFDRVFDFYQGHKDYVWTPQQRDNKLTQVIELLRRSEK